MKHDPIATTYQLLREAGDPLKTLLLRGRLVRKGSVVIVHAFRHTQHIEFKDAKVTDLKDGVVELHLPHGEMTLRFTGHGEPTEGIYDVEKQWTMEDEMEELHTVALELVK